MKKLLLFSSIILLAFVDTYAQGVWVSQATGFTDVSSGVRNISVVDTNTVWISPYDGAGAGLPRQDYSRTTNGGSTWTAGLVPIAGIWDWSMIHAVDSMNAWAVFFNTAVSPVGLGRVWHTTDGGVNWNLQGSGQIFTTAGESFPNVIKFFNDTDGVVIGDPKGGEFEIYTTHDGGTTWVAVPGSDIPDPSTVDEAGWTTHIDTYGDNVWFDTNEGRVYHSTDRGYHWTVSNPNLGVPVPGSIDLCFMNGLKGIARYYNDTTLISTIAETNDGGTTWSNTFTATGNFFGADVKAVPGTAQMLVSTGVSNFSGYTGSSYSNDGGHTWVDIETGTQRNALGIADSLTMWCGGFTTSPTAGGIYKFLNLAHVACNDPSVTPGIPTGSVGAICGGDTITVTSNGVFSPFNGAFSGVSWVLTSADISSSPNPLLEASFLTSYRITFPAPSSDSRFYVNDGSIIDGTNLAWGTYYWTPVVFGNAAALTSPPVFLQDLSLDASCTFTGTSVAVVVMDPSDPNCLNGVNEVKGNQLAVHSYILDRNTLDVLINSVAHGKVSIQISDIMGRVVKTQTSYVSKGSNHEFINVENLASGTYILKAEVNGNLATNKVVKY